MAEISNSFLAVLLVIAIMIAIVGAWTSIDKVNRLVGITGMGTSGYVNLTIANMSSLNVTATECNFGVGAVNAGSTSAILASNGTVVNWNSTGTSTNMSLKNDGNQNFSVNVSSGKNTTTFLGGGSTLMAYKVWYAGNKSTSGGCLSWPAAAIFPGIEINTTASIKICDNLGTATGWDEFFVGCYIGISDNTPAGSKTDTWTFTATVV